MARVDPSTKPPTARSGNVLFLPGSLCECMKIIPDFETLAEDKG